MNALTQHLDKNGGLAATHSAENDYDISRVRARCQSCGEPRPIWQLLYPDKDLYRCPACMSFSYLPKVPVPLTPAYDVSYFSGAEYDDYRGHERVHRINFERKWRLLAALLPSEVALLEIGCAYGFFIDVAKRKGAARAFGVDVSREAISFAKAHFGHDSFAAVGENSDPPFVPNVLVAWDVFEHLPYPYEQFNGWTSSMPAGSIVALTTVDSSAFMPRFRRSKWRQIHPPTHVHYPTRLALCALMDRLGFEVCYHKSFGVHRALETYLSALGLKHVSRIAPRFGHLPIPLNLGDTQMVIAKKRFMRAS